MHYYLPGDSNPRLAKPFEGPAVASGQCDCCSVCQGSARTGFVMCFDGVFTVFNDYPATGGPWTPAVYPNGTVTWVNAGG